jgi:hypothetical protein
VLFFLELNNLEKYIVHVLQKGGFAVYIKGVAFAKDVLPVKSFAISFLKCPLLVLLFGFYWKFRIYLIDTGSKLAFRSKG